VRVAVLGLGSAGRRHARLLAELGHEPLGFDPAGGADSLDSEEAALSQAEAVVVASPNELHDRQALAAIDRGLPVLVEKPLAVSPERAREVAAAAVEKGVVCAVAMNLRFHPGPIALHRLVQSGELGRPLLARASFGYDLRRWRPGTDYRESYSARSELGGGIALDAIHELDYLLWMLGEPEEAVGFASRLSDLEIDVEDTVAGAIRFASGALATVDLNFFEQAYRRGCVVAGTEASAEWEWNAETVAVRDGGGERMIPVACDLADTYRGVLSDFLEAAAGLHPPRTSAADGATAVALAQSLKPRGG
jgi:predicted dehydrogenase